MIRIYLVGTVFCLFSQVSPAQIAAGIYDSLMVGQDSIKLDAFALAFGNIDKKSDSLDFNGDGRYDASFTAEAAKITDYTGAATSVYALHSGFEMLVDTDGQILPLALGDSIKPTQNWGTASPNGVLFSGVFKSNFLIFLQHFELGHWVSGQNAFAGFRVITATKDTLYGWINVTSSLNLSAITASLAIKSNWAVQFDPSNTETTERPAQEVRLFPNPVCDVAAFSIAGQDFDNTQLRIFDLNGELHCMEIFKGSKGDLQLSELPAGIYVWELRGKGWRKSGKLVKE